MGADRTTHAKVEQGEESPGDFEVYPRGAPFALCSRVLVVLGYLKKFFLDALHYAGIPLRVHPLLELPQEQHHGDVVRWHLTFHGAHARARRPGARLE